MGHRLSDSRRSPLEYPGTSRWESALAEAASTGSVLLSTAKHAVATAVALESCAYSRGRTPRYLLASAVSSCGVRRPLCRNPRLTNRPSIEVHTLVPVVAAHHKAASQRVQPGERALQLGTLDKYIKALNVLLPPFPQPLLPACCCCSCFALDLRTYAMRPRLSIQSGNFLNPRRLYRPSGALSDPGKR